MGFNFRKSFKIGGSRLNIGKKGASVSTGIKGFRITTGANGSKISAGAGGVRYTAKLGKNNKTSKTKNKNTMTSLEIFYSSIFLFIITVLCKIKGFNFWGMTTWFMTLSFLIAVISFMLSRSVKKRADKTQNFDSDCDK